MAKERDLQLQKYSISGNRYRELKYFCRQYREKQSQLRSITEIASPSFDGVGGGSGISDRTATTAMKRMQLEWDLRLVEQCAIETDGDLYPYILTNVVDGVPYKYLDVPCSMSTFKRRRRKFFFLLSEKS